MGDLRLDFRLIPLFRPRRQRERVQMECGERRTARVCGGRLIDDYKCVYRAPPVADVSQSSSLGLPRSPSSCGDGVRLVRRVARIVMPARRVELSARTIAAIRSRRRQRTRTRQRSASKVLFPSVALPACSLHEHEHEHEHVHAQSLPNSSSPSLISMLLLRRRRV